jgi:hypothetical protein
VRTVEDITQRLLGIPLPIGQRYNWERVLTALDEETVRVLNGELAGDGGVRDMILIIAACNGYDGMGRVLGKSGIKHTAVRFIHHAVATVDVVVFVRQPVWHPHRLSSSANRELSYIRESYYALTPPSGRRAYGPLTELERGFANTVCLENLLGLEISRDETEYFAQHYSVIEPALSVVVERADMSRAMVDQIRESPALSLTAGAL